MSQSNINRQGSRPWLSWTVLLVLLGVALALRWRYIREISLFVDEFVTAWAARNVLERGLPIFPSGNLYPHGFLFTYLVAPFVLGEFNETLARIPGLLVGLAGLPVAYWVGRRLFSDGVGLVAAAAMAVDPDFIVWGGRARMYGLLQLLTLLAVYVYYRGLADDRPRDRYLAIGLLFAAIFTHAEAAFLLPALAVATLLAWPWRRLFRWSVVLPFAIGVAGAVVFFLMAKYGQPGHLETLQESRPYLALSADLLSGPRAFAPVFTTLHRLPFTLLGIAALFFLFRPRFDRRAPLTYLYVVFVAFVILLILPAGATWQRERYLFLVLPFLFLVGGEVMRRLLCLLPIPGRVRSWQMAFLSFVVALFVGLTGAQAAYIQEWGYDLAFRHLREQWDPERGDRIVTSMSPASMLYLGRTDAFAIQRGYEEYIIARPGDNLPADLWTATPAITTTAAFTELLATAPRVWFVADGWRFQTRYNADFIVTVLDQMEQDYNERGVMVFRTSAEGPTSLEPAIRRERRAEFGGELLLTGFDLSSARPNPGDELQVTLYWQALEQAQPAYTAFLHLVGPGGVGLTGVDEPLLRGFYQPDLWPQDQLVPDRHRLVLPPGMAPGRYRLELGLYHPGQADQPLSVEGGNRLILASLMVGDVAVPPPPATRTDITFGDVIRLVGFDLITTLHPATTTLQLHWQAVGPIDRDYTVFTHVLDTDGAIVTQHDAPPGDAFFPTSTWLPGDTVLDPHPLVLPAGRAAYRLLVGLYHLPTQARLQATDADGEPLGDAVLLTTFVVGEKTP